MKVTVEVNETKGLMLTQDVASGTFNGIDYQFMVGLPSMSPIVSINGKRYIISSSEIVQAMIEEVLKKTEEESKVFDLVHANNEVENDGAIIKFGKIYKYAVVPFDQREETFLSDDWVDAYQTFKKFADL